VNQIEEPPTELLFQLLLAIHNVGISLIDVEINMTAPRDFTLALSKERLHSLAAATKHLKVFTLRVSGEDSNSLGPRLPAEEVESLHSFLSTFTDAKTIGRLDLDLSFLTDFRSTHMVSLGHFLTSRPWPTLKIVDLTAYPIHLTELEKFLGKLDNRIYMHLSRIHLMSGTWADALDVLCSKADYHSNLDDPSGAECEDMSDEEMKAIFGRGPEPDYRESKATEYIRWGGHPPFKGCPIVRNPLRRNESGEAGAGQEESDGEDE
jgi:hypothetical protein